MSKKGALPCPPNVSLFVGLPGWFVCFWCRAREALRQCLPDQLKDTTFAQVLKDDTTTKRWLAQLVKNLQEGQVTDPRGIPLPPQWSSPVPPTTSPSWGREGESARKTAQVLLSTGNRTTSMLNCTGEEGQGTPAEVYGLPSQAALTTWAPSATPRRWASDTAVCHHSPRRVSAPANAVLAACPRWPFSPTST